MRNLLTPVVVPYLNWRWRLLLAVIGAHLLITEGQYKPFWQLFGQLNYYRALFFSILVGVVFVEWTHHLWRYLDVRLAWRTQWVWRGTVQVLLGVLLLLVVDIWLVKGFFMLCGKDFNQSGFMYVEFPLLKYMLLTLNAIYGLKHWLYHYRHSESGRLTLLYRLEQTRNVKKEQNKYPRLLSVSLGNKKIQINVADVVCFHRTRDAGWAYLEDNRRFNVEQTMDQLQDLLNPECFVKIGRSVLINLIHVEGYQSVGNRQARVIFRKKLDIECSVLVSRARLNNFKESWAGFNTRFGHDQLIA